MYTDTPGELLPVQSPPPLDSDVTPSNTTVTLPTPDPVHAQLVGPECHSPPRFIFYPISWDGSEDPPAQSKRPCLDTQKDAIDDEPLISSPAVFCSTDTFRSIDRWRHDIVKCDDDTADLLDPIQDADTPLPLLSLPRDRHGGLVQRTPPARPLPCGTNSTGSEDGVRLWIHP